MNTSQLAGSVFQVHFRFHECVPFRRHSKEGDRSMFSVSFDSFFYCFGLKEGPYSCRDITTLLCANVPTV